MAPMPGGNANVFARALGWPSIGRPGPAGARRGPRAGRRCATRSSAGCGWTRASARIFTINAGVGIDAATVEWIEARPRTKRRLRHAGFALGAAVAAAPLRAGAAPARERRRRARPVEAAAVLAACGSPYTYLGPRPLDLVPGAAFDGRDRLGGPHADPPGEVGGLRCARPAGPRAAARRPRRCAAARVGRGRGAGRARPRPCRPTGRSSGATAQVRISPRPDASARSTRGAPRRSRRAPARRPDSVGDRIVPVRSSSSKEARA